MQSLNAFHRDVSTRERRVSLLRDPNTHFRAWLSPSDGHAQVSALKKPLRRCRSSDQRASVKGIHEEYPRLSQSIHHYKKGLPRLCTRPTPRRHLYRSSERAGCVSQWFGQSWFRKNGLAVSEFRAAQLIGLSR